MTGTQWRYAISTFPRRGSEDTARRPGGENDLNSSWGPLDKNPRAARGTTGRPAFSQRPPLRPPPRPPAHKQRTYAGLIALALVALLVFGGVYTAIAVGGAVFQPKAAAGAPAQQLIVRSGETTTQIADDLEQHGVVRSALLFRLWAKYRGLDRQLQAGVYLVSPSMTMDEIITTLERSVPSQMVVTVPEGTRATEYPQYLSGLTHFDAHEFLQIVKTGQFAGRDRYWYVAAPAPGVTYALEGYLFPSTYYVDPQATATDVVKVMLNGVGLELCPGPDRDPNRYLFDEQQCRAHARVVDSANHLTIFTALEQRHLTLLQALTLASVVQREARSATAKAGVASVYYNRYLAATGAQPGPDDGGPITLDADPTVQYAVGTAANPWPTLQAQARTIAPDSPFNTYTHAGLPPGPIAGSGLDVLIDVVAAPRTNYYYFITGADHQMHFAHTYAEHQQNIARYGIG